MTRNDIIRMAREAGWSGIYSKPLMSIAMQENDFLRFAALVAAAEREACAKACDGWMHANGNDCAEAIRARGEV
jgi:hypothetical protein